MDAVLRLKGSGNLDYIQVIINLMYSLWEYELEKRHCILDRIWAMWFMLVSNIIHQLQIIVLSLSFCFLLITPFPIVIFSLSLNLRPLSLSFTLSYPPPYTLFISLTLPFHSLCLSPSLLTFYLVSFSLSLSLIPSGHQEARRIIGRLLPRRRICAQQIIRSRTTKKVRMSVRGCTVN